MIRILISVPFIVLMVLFALSNPQPVQLHLWPTDYALEVPLSLAVLTGMGVAFIFGAFVLWFAAAAARGRARRARREVVRLKQEVAALQARLDVPMRENGSLPAHTPSMALIGTK